jgi:hypothetical protein
MTCFQLRALGLVLLSACLHVAPIHAHHSGAMFDRSKTLTLIGTVKEYQFVNPHVWIELMVPGKSAVLVQWSIEAESPPLMARLGLKPKTLRAGDRVTVRTHPLRDGRPGGSFVSLTLADGKQFGTRIQLP